MFNFADNIKSYLATASVFQRPCQVAKPLAWVGHIPFAFWIVEQLRPKTVVELGTHIGNSYFAFCQQIKALNYSCQSYAIDTWKGDEHSGFYSDEVYHRVFNINEDNYSSFSTLIRSTFDEALENFTPGSIDLLHIDGLHTYEAVKHDFETWFPKVSDKGVILFHDISVRHDKFGVWKLWQEISSNYPSFSFNHGFGLGVLLVGEKVPDNLKQLSKILKDSDESLIAFRSTFEFLGTTLCQLYQTLPEPQLLKEEDEENQENKREQPLVKSQSELDWQRKLQLQKQEYTLLLNKFYQMKEEIEKFYSWQERYKNLVHELRCSVRWRIMRSLARFSDLFIRNRNEGRLGFLKWILYKFIRKSYPLSQSYDPLESLELPSNKKFKPLNKNNYFSQNPFSTSDSNEVKQTPELKSNEPIWLKKGEVINAPISVVIPLKGAINWLSMSLEFLSNSLHPELIAEIIVVDDGSSESEINKLIEIGSKYKNLSIIQNTAVHGFASACNLGANMSSADFILFLNSDCLVASNTLFALLDTFKKDNTVGLACSLANNASNNSISIPVGKSFLELDITLHKKYQDDPQQFVDACTVVGHCLMASRICFESLGGFDTDWGLGYGEETDLQMRAQKKGFRSVIALNTYVYHFGGGSFQYEKDVENLRKTNHQRFMDIWGKDYQDLSLRCQNLTPQRILKDTLLEANNQAVTADLLFILPGIAQGVGGIMTVADLCNFLIQKGINAKILILGELKPQFLLEYKEPLLFNPIVAKSEAHLMNMINFIKPKIVLPTLYSTLFSAKRFAEISKAQLLYFVQGYECYFENGRAYSEAKSTYQSCDQILTTSSWLTNKISRHNPNATVYQIPLGVDTSTFFPRVELLNFINEGTLEFKKKLRVSFLLRTSSDKGQYVLTDIIDLLKELKSTVSITVFVPSDWNYQLAQEWLQESDTLIVSLPLDRYSIARYLRASDIFIDASLHEGYGLLPLEAMACGCAVIASNSGGINDFIKDQENGVVVTEVNQPEKYLEAIKELIFNKSKLFSIRKNALLSSKALDSNFCWQRYQDLFTRLLNHQPAQPTFTSKPANLKAKS